MFAPKPKGSDSGLPMEEDIERVFQKAYCDLLFNVPNLLDVEIRRGKPKALQMAVAVSMRLGFDTAAIAVASKRSMTMVQGWLLGKDLVSDDETRTEICRNIQKMIRDKREKMLVGNPGLK